MSTMKLACPGCAQHIECDSGYGGTEIQCPACTAPMLIPTLAAESVSDAGATPALNIDHSRPEIQEFGDFYAREIEPYLATRHDQQKSARRFALWAGVVGTILTLLVGWLLFHLYGWNETTIIATVFMTVATGVAVWWKLDDLQKAVKGFLLLEVCRFFGFTHSEHAQSVGFADFAESGLLPRYDWRELEDHIHGSHNGVDFDLFECWLKKEKGSGDNKRSKEVYHGVLFRLAFPKQFKGRTLVLKDRGVAGNFLKNLKTTGERIKLEDPRFEKLYEVWGNDQVEARYLLTPTFMERIVELANAIDSKRLEVCFLNNLLLVSAHVRKNQFEGGGLFTNVTDKRRVEQLVSEICRVFDIVDTLQLALKTRI